mgnify:FL=1
MRGLLALAMWADSAMSAAAMLHIETRGSGPAVVVLHGTPQDPDSFLDTLTGVTLHVVHLPGYGRSSSSVPISDMQAVERAIEEACEQRGIESPVLVGCSGGAYRALSIALHGRMSLAGLGLVGGFAGLAPEHRAALRQMADLFEQGHDMSEPLRAAMFSEGFVKREPERAQRYVEATLASAPPRILADDLRAAADAPDLGPRLRPLTIPVQLAVGELDAATPLAYSHVLATGLDVELQRVPAVGHLLHLEAPSVWQAIIDALVVERSMR